MRGRPIQAPAIISVPNEVVLHCDAEGKATSTVVVRTYEKSGSPSWIAGAMSDRPIVSIKPSDMEEVDSPEPGVKTRLYKYSLSANRISDNPAQNCNSAARIALKSAAPADIPLASFYVRLEEWRPVRLVPEVLFIEHVDGMNDIIARDVRVVFCDERFHPTGVDAIGSVSWIHVKSVTLSNDGDKREALIAVEIQPGHMASGETIRPKLLVKAHGDHANSADVTVPVIVKTKSLK
jgi:hypothetical protein